MDNLSQKIPWYRTRLFWGVTYVLLVIASAFVFWNSVLTPNVGVFSNGLRLIFSSTGGALILILGEYLNEFINMEGGYIYLHLGLIATLLFQTLRNERPIIIYPIVLIAVLLIGNLVWLAFLGGY